MKISIAMATYNGAQYIQEQLQSFVDQTRQPDELIITDDCSADQTETIVREFAKTAPFRVEFYRNEHNLGYCGNFSAALMKTTGDLVFLSDQDDVWFPDKIEQMVDFSEQHPDALVMMNDAALTDSELRDVGLTKIGQIRSGGYGMKTFVMGCCCLVRRELLDLCLPIPSGFRGHDDWLVQFASDLNAKVINPKALQYYRRHETNESQFLANRLVKITRIHVGMHAIKKLLIRDAESCVTKQLEQARLFVGAVSRAKTRASRKQGEILFSTEVRYRNQITFLEQRVDVVKKSFFPRMIAVTQLLVSGAYGNARGFRSLMEDIVG